MANSSLVVYTKISPFKTVGRNHTIDTITIHHMAGNLSIETCGNVFQTREASSNYGVDSNGRVGMYVEEKDRSWCSSNKANDNRAITIEVADCNSKWEVSDKAMKALIELIVDCCKRNNIKKLVWSNNKNDRINHKNGCNMTVHRDFSSTSCPGDWLYGKMAYIADEVNKKLLNLDGINDFVERMYTVILGRPSDPAGKKSWVDSLLNGNTGAAVAKGFIYSPEFQTKQKSMTDDVYVETLYKAFFNRKSDPEGKKYWCSRLAAGATRNSIVDGFIGSQEWINLCNSYGIKAK